MAFLAELQEQGKTGQQEQLALPAPAIVDTPGPRIVEEKEVKAQQPPSLKRHASEESLSESGPKAKRGRAAPKKAAAATKGKKPAPMESDEEEKSDANAFTD